MGENPKPWEGCETTEKARRSLDGLRETFAVGDLPSGLVELAGSESGVHDVYMNAKRMLDAGKLDRPAKLLVAVGVASAKGSADAVRFLGAAARAAGCAPQEVLDAVSVAAACTTFNAYYRFRHHVRDAGFDEFRAAFNANSFLSSAIGPTRTALVCIAVSSVNGCPDCVRGHVDKARSLGATAEQIDEAVRAAAAAQALAAVASALAAAPVIEPIS